MEEKIEKRNRLIEIDAKRNDFGMLFSDYLQMSYIFRNSGDQLGRLRCLLIAIYIKLSGMTDENVVVNYMDLEHFFTSKIWNEFAVAKNKANLDNSSLLNLFKDTVSKCKFTLPFCYFDFEIIERITIDYLSGERNLLKKYESFIIKPDLRSSNYKVEIKKGRSLDTLPDNYVLLDIETTGLNPKLDNIIEVGCIKIRNGKEFGRYKSLIKTPLELSGKIKKMTGLTDDVLSKAPEMETIAPRLWAFLKNEVIVGHNINFDIQFLYINFYETLGKIFDNDYFDTLKLVREAFPEFKKYNLDNICDELKICAGHHRAIADCLVVKEIIDRIHKNRDNEYFTIIEEDLDEESASKYALNLIKSIGNDDHDNFESVLNFCNELVANELATVKLCKKMGSICEKFEEYYSAISFYESAEEIDPELDFSKKIKRLNKKIYNF